MAIPILARKDFAKVTEAIMSYPECRKATLYVSDKCTIKATRQFKMDKRNTRETVLLTYGAPNYAEREFIKTRKKAGEPLPLKKVQLAWWPKKKKATQT